MMNEPEIKNEIVVTKDGCGYLTVNVKTKIAFIFIRKKLIKYADHLSYEITDKLPAVFSAKISKCYDINEVADYFNNYNLEDYIIQIKDEENVV